MLKGKCLCGKVSLNAAEVDPGIGACHCGMCRKWTGGPFVTIDCGTSATIEGEENLSLYDSSAWAERAFCKNCGSSLFYRLKQSGQIIASLGLFDDVPENFEFDHQIFIDKKPKFYEFANKTKNMTEAEVFAKYSG